MTAELDDLRNEIALEAAGSQVFEVEAFARAFARRLEDAEQVFDLNVEPLRCIGPRGRRLELLGYAEDTTEQSLVILSGRYFGDDSTLTLTEAKSVLARASAFIEAAVDGWSRANLEMSSREYEYALYFADQIVHNRVAKLRMILITDGIMSDRIRAIDSDRVAGVRATYEVWDQKRLLDAALPSRSSEDIDIDLTRWLPNGLPCLQAQTTSDSIGTFLAVVPGQLLADVFQEWGSLLLESNVRTFLSARGAVNRGIQATLAQEPDKFLAYNNGLTTTARSVELAHDAGGSFIQRIRGWQVVNGGQTTASLVHFLRTSGARNIHDVSVQMKLVTVSEADRTSIVQSVAKYANSQNRVSGADLFTTHPFHVRMEQISRRLRAPATEGHQYQTGWFYERARGQWENDRLARGPISEQKKFELIYPKTQRVTKTDWAKYAFCWGKKPHLVSRGAQSVFAEYATQVDALWQKEPDKFGDGYFRTNIGKAIMYEALRKAVLKQPWYQASPGYLANIVAYGIARFAVSIEQTFDGLAFDWGRVWGRQGLSDATISGLIDCARAAQSHLTSASRPQANVTQWAKQEAAWDGLRRIRLTLPADISDDLVDAEDVRTRAIDDRKLRALDTSIESTKRVLEVSRDVWRTVRSAPRSSSLSPMEASLVDLFGLASQRGIPSDKQAAALLRALDRMAQNGVIPRDSY